MSTTANPVEIRLPSTIDDFEVGDRVVWQESRLSFGTVTKVEDGKLTIAIDVFRSDDNLHEVTETGSGNDWKDSYISQWRVFPNIHNLEVGDVLSTTSEIYTWDRTQQTRYFFTITHIVPEKEVHLQANHDMEYEVVLKGDNFSRILEDAIYDWQKEG